jgi:hypothetical protein
MLQVVGVGNIPARTPTDELKLGGEQTMFVYWIGKCLL